MAGTGWPEDADARIASLRRRCGRAFQGNRALVVRFRLAVLLQEAGRYRDARRLVNNCIHQATEHYGADAVSIAPLLTELARIEVSLGEYDRAEALYRRSMTLFQEAGLVDAPSNSRNLQGLGLIAKTRSDLRAAKTWHALALKSRARVRGKRSIDFAETLCNQGIVYKEMGLYEQGLTLMEQALSIVRERNPNNLGLRAYMLNTIASVHRVLERHREARAIYQQAFDLRVRAHGRHHPFTATTLNNLALTVWDIDGPQQARSLLEETVELYRLAYGDSHLYTASALYNLGYCHGELGDLDRSEELIRRSADVYIAAGRGVHSYLPRRFLHLYKMREAQERGDPRHLVRALPCLTGSTFQPQPAFRNLDALARHLARDGKTDAAILMAKKAVAVVDGMQSHFARSRSLADSLYADCRGVYHHACELLVDHGRLAEALVTFRLLKQEDAAALRPTRQPAAVQLGLSLAERELDRQLDGLVASARARADKGVSSLASFEQAVAPFVDQWLAQAAGFRPATRPSPVAVREVMRPGVASIQFMNSRAVLASTTGLRTVPLPLADLTLRRLVADLRFAIEAHCSLVQLIPLLRELDDGLMRPIREALNGEAIDTVSLGLDGAARQIPFSALHDGSGFLCERFRVVVETSGARSLGEPSGKGAVLAFGASASVRGLPPLPHVADEVAAVAGDGAILDSAFTLRALVDAIAARPRILHLATHFEFNPADASHSRLILGDGGAVGVDEIAGWDFQGIELVTLSACESGASPEATEGLAALIRERGARSVLATLWRVEDSSTAAMMAGIYRRSTDLPLAEALRQTQIARIHGDDRLAHPFLWAPFVLFEDGASYRLNTQ